MWKFDARWLREYGEYFYLGTMFPACIIVGLIIGWGIDYFLPTDPWGKIAGLFFGVVAAFVNFIRDYQKIQRKKKNEPKKY